MAEKTNWKYLGTYTGRQDINIPVSASHLLLQGYYTGSSKSVIQDELAWNDLDADATVYPTGNVSVNAIYTVNKPDNKITLRDCQILVSWTSPSWVNHANEYVQKIWYR